jgi:hypothetical protein
MTQEQKDQIVVAEAEKLVAAGKPLNDYTIAVLIRLARKAVASEEAT